MSNELFQTLPDIIDAKMLAETLSISKSGAYALMNANNLERIVNMNYAQTKGTGYVNWVKIHNVKAMGATLINTHWKLRLSSL